MPDFHDDFDDHPSRPIKTVYFKDLNGTKPVKVTRSKWANNAVPNCIRHMQLNLYGARLATVEDESVGELHAVITHSVAGEIRILFKRKVKEGM